MRLAVMAVGLGSLAVAGAAASGVVSASPAGADPMADCTTTTGVVVVVDFAPWGGNVVRGCAAGPTTGYGAMVAAGFTPAGDQHDGDAFVCRIDDDPPPNQDPCVDTPPPNASWSYWYAASGASTWTYSQAGFMDRCPPPGSVDAWVFVGTQGAGPTGYPPFAPSAVLATTPGPATTADPCVAPGSSGTSSGSGSGSGSDSGSGSGSGSAGGGSATSSQPSSPSTLAATQPTLPTAGAPTTAPTASAPSSSGPGTTPDPGQNPAAAPKATAPGPRRTTTQGETGSSASQPRIVDASPASIDHHLTSGSPLPLAIGGCLAALLAGGGGLVAWRRRRQQLDQP